MNAENELNPRIRLKQRDRREFMRKSAVITLRERNPGVLESREANGDERVASTRRE